MKREEQALQAAIVQGLRVALPPGWCVHHSPNGGLRTQAEAGIFKRLGTEAGRPDIEINGESEGWGASTYFFEVKASKGAVTDIQRRYHEKLRELGFPVAVVRSWEDVLVAAKQWRLPLRLAALS